MSPQEIARNHARERRINKPLLQDTVAIVGLGYVGLPLAILAAEKDKRVIGFDIDEVKIAQLEKREANFLSEDEAVAFRSAKQLDITSDEKALDAAGAFIICVPTPVHEDHEPDLAPLKSASEIVGRHL